MWSITILPYLLLMFNPSDAEFGLPVVIPNLRSTIETTIGNGVQPLNKTLRELQMVAQKHPSVFQITEDLLDAMANTSQVVEDVFKNISEALGDGESGWNKVFARLIVKVNNAIVQLPALMEMLPDYLVEYVGIDRVKSVRDSWKTLENGLSVLKKSLSALNDTISTAQRTTTITTSNIGSLVTPKQIDDLKGGLQLIMTSVTKLNDIASVALDLFKVMSSDVEQTYGSVDNIMNFTRIERLMNATVMEAINSARKITQNINQTVLTSYQPLTRIKLINNAESIATFITKFDSLLAAANSTEKLFRMEIQQQVVNKLASFRRYIANFNGFNLDSIFTIIMKNGTMAEKCFRQHPLIDDSLAKVAKLVDGCVRQQLTYLPSIVNFIQELLAPIRVILLSPIRDLQTCTSHLSQKFCFPSFANALNSPNKTSLLTVVQSLMEEVEPLTRNEVGSAYQRIETCADSQSYLATLMGLLSKRMACYKG